MNQEEYVFNSENRMTGYRKCDISSNLLTSADYYYDPAGRRMAKSVDGVLTRYIYHEEDIWCELGSDGTVARSYFHGPGIDEPIGLWFDSQLYTTYMYAYMADALGTIRDIARPYSGAPIAASFYYDSFGQIMSSSTTGWPDPYRFTAREWSAENGTYFFRSRSYAPRVGRFGGEDAISFFGGANFYLYASNAPTRYVDPLGYMGEIIQFPGNPNPPGLPGPGKGDLCKFKPAPPIFMDPKNIGRTAGRAGGIVVLSVVVIGSANCVIQEIYCWAVQTNVSPCECMQFANSSYCGGCGPPERPPQPPLDPNQSCQDCP